jgi:hypothetical protein
MSTARACLVLAATAFGIALATTSCGSDEVGTPGAGGGLIGAGGTGTGGNAGFVGRTGGMGGAGGGAVSTRLGSACINDAECGDGLTCALPNSGLFEGEGPAKGLCTVPCTSNQTCIDISASASCVGVGGASNDAFCFEGCALGMPNLGVLKCHNRPEVACSPLVDQANNAVGAACLPTCAQDADCSGGTFCSPSTGRCTSTRPAAGQALGSACDPAAVADPCHGFCSPTGLTGAGESIGSCMELCSFGSQCAFSGATAAGACVLVLDPAESIGDLGFCAQVCNCTTDCGASGYSCIDWGSANLRTAFGSNGFCFQAGMGDAVLDCDGGTGGTGGTGSSGAGGEAGASGATGQAGAAGG